MVSALERKIDETENYYAEMSKLSDNELINRLTAENKELKVRCLCAGLFDVSFMWNYYL